MVSSKVTHVCEIMTCLTNYGITSYFDTKMFASEQNIFVSSLVIIVLLVRKLKRGRNPATPPSPFIVTEPPKIPVVMGLKVKRRKPEILDAQATTNVLEGQQFV